MKENEEICKVPFLGTIINANFNICEQILDAYHRQVPQPRDKSRVSDSYVGKLNWYNHPYQVSIYGAYPLMTQWEMLECKIDNSSEEQFKAYRREVVFEHLKEFAKGFQWGYDHFLQEKVNDQHLLSSTENAKVQAIMDFLSSPFEGFGFSEAHGTGDHLFSNWYEDGKIGGYHYCAWVIIFKNHKLFEPHFKDQCGSERKVTSNQQNNFWQGSNEQKLKLFEELAIEFFLENSPSNRSNFLNNQPVQWKQDARSLFYLLDHLRNKKYKMLDWSENLGPLIRNNFVDKKGLPFKNVSQNISGMNNNNKSGKPRHGVKIEEILVKVFQT